MRATSPVHAFAPQTPDGLPVEVQRLDETHVLHRMGAHGHLFFELIVIETPGGPHRVGPTLHPTRRGQVFIIPPGEVHDCTDLGPRCTGWVLLLTHEALDGLAATSRSYTADWPSHHPLLSPFFAIGRAGSRIVDVSSDLDRWCHRFDEVAREIAERRAGYRHAVQAHLTLTLLDLLRLSGTPQAAPLGDGSDHVLRQAFVFIEGRFRNPISASDVAKAVGRSVAHLTTTMRERTGLTVGDWIGERRMAEARRRLVATTDTLDVVADQTGYSGREAFSRAFRRAHRLSPEAWRRAHRHMPPYA